MPADELGQVGDDILYEVGNSEIDDASRHTISERQQSDDFSPGDLPAEEVIGDRVEGFVGGRTVELHVVNHLVKFDRISLVHLGRDEAQF